MAYSGWLIKVGDFEISAKSIIKADSYKVTKNSQDLDSYRDANGELHRTSLEHQPNKVEFETVPMMTNVQFASLMANIQRNYINATEKSAYVTLYVPETDSYVTQKMYMADITPQMYGTYDNVIHYDSIRFAFIGY